MATPPVFLHPARDGVTIEVHVQPGARRAGFAGVHGDALKIAVREPARQGAANAAVCGLVARALGVPPSSVEVFSGHRSRRKRLKVIGVDMATAVQRLHTVPDDPGNPKSPS